MFEAAYGLLQVHRVSVVADLLKATYVELATLWIAWNAATLLFWLRWLCVAFLARSLQTPRAPGAWLWARLGRGSHAHLGRKPSAHHRW